jgi:hypothetical protein
MQMLPFQDVACTIPAVNDGDPVAAIGQYGKPWAVAPSPESRPTLSKDELQQVISFLDKQYGLSQLPPEEDPKPDHIV